MVGRLDVDRGAEAKLFNIYINNMGGGDVRGKLDRIVVGKVIKEKEKRIITMGPQQENIYET